MKTCKDCLRRKPAVWMHTEDRCQACEDDFQRELEPDVACSLYRYYDQDNELLYVGITARGHRRQAEHYKVQSWWHEVHHATFEHFSCREEALFAESEAIHQERPRYNVQRGVREAPAFDWARYWAKRGKGPDGEPIEPASTKGLRSA